ncbi:MAG: hypothetical protein DRO87_04295 [Candidatus Thorarchaeota archaeon]|nr:MAG: hypothetical protein DRP09_09275 [Candidatus Thorarchaeota archaeon]RLI58983.1 MAG: hypothetical protein DRO87_04295 [Candidatus Thorarchaeota archaeon]
MREHLVLGFLLIVVIFTPVLAYTLSPEPDGKTPMIVEGVSNRVYGVNLAQEVYSAISQEIYMQHVIKLTENGSRYIMDYSSIRGPNAAARDWILEELDSLSGDRLQIELLGHYDNIIATLPGYLPGDHPAFVITAHYDSVEDSPGANGDASGIAAILELARVMSEYEWPLDIVFVALNGHDAQGAMQGAREVATSFRNNDKEIMALYNIDTILYDRGGMTADNRVIFSYLDGQPYQVGEYWADLAEMMGTLYGIDTVTRMSSVGFDYWESADSYQFVTSDYHRILCVFESRVNWDTAYHTPADTWDYSRYNYALARDITGYIAASMAFTMSRAYGHINHIEDETYISPAFATEYSVAITAPTRINISARWYGGGATFSVYNPDGIMVDTAPHNETSPWNMVRVLSTSVSTPGLYTVVINNHAQQTIGVDLEIEYDSDADGNGVLDSKEYWLDTALFHTDDDNDGISNAEEIILGTDPSSADTDQDGLPDLWEVENGLNPIDANDAQSDLDGDGLTNLAEYEYSLNPRDPDSDSDTLPDSWEIEYGLDPLVNDAEEDPDGDGWTNAEEFARGTDPLVSDSVEEPQLWYVIPVSVVVLAGVGLAVSRRLDPLRE